MEAGWLLGAGWMVVGPAQVLLWGAEPQQSLSVPGGTRLDWPSWGGGLTLGWVARRWHLSQCWWLSVKGRGPHKTSSGESTWRLSGPGWERAGTGEIGPWQTRLLG